MEGGVEVVPAARAAIALHGRRLELFSITWNSLEGLLAVVAGVQAGSISLVGFGLDSFIEVTSASALLWRMSVDKNKSKRERSERLALRIVGACFVLLALYLVVDSARALISRKTPEHSVLGIVTSVAALIVMPLLSRAKRRVAFELGSAAMKADSRQTDFCVYLSAILLFGLSANWLFGWWWADPVAALLMTPIILKEGLDALKGRTCPECHVDGLRPR